MKNMSFKKRIYEQETSNLSTNVKGTTVFQNPIMKLAVNVGCFKEKQFVPTINQTDNAEAFFRDMTGVKDYEKFPYLYLTPNADGVTFRLSYRDKNNVEQANQEKIACRELEQTTNPLVTSDQAKIVDYLKQYGFNDYESVTDPSQRLNSELVNITKDPYALSLLKNNPLFLAQIKGSGPRTFWMWKGRNTIEGLSADVEEKGNQAQKLVDYLKTQNGGGYVTIIPVGADQAEYYKINLKNQKDYTGDLYQYKDYATYFNTDYFLYKKVDTTPTAGGSLTQDACRQIVLDYYNEMENGNKPAPNLEDKRRVEKCLTTYQGKYPRLKNVILKLVTPSRDKIGYQIANRDYTARPSFANRIGLGQVTKESKETQLKNIISENLMRLKKKTINEDVIIKQRFLTISEGRDLRKKRDVNLFLNDILLESVYLNHKGYNTDILKEQYLEMAQKFLSGTGTDALFQYFKEYAAKWILQSLKIDTNSWLASIFITSVGNLPIGDIFKLTDCDYAVPYFTKSLIEGLVRKFLVSKGLENPITSIIRNAITEVIEDVSFVQKLQKSLSKTICPMWGGLANKMDKVGEKLVQNTNKTTTSSTDNKPTATNMLSTASSIMSAAKNFKG
jgi:hypothetical protein